MPNEIIRLAVAGLEQEEEGKAMDKKKKKSGGRRLREETSNDVDGSRSAKTPQRWRVRAKELIGDKNPLAT